MAIVVRIQRQFGVVVATLDEGAALRVPPPLFRERRFAEGDALDADDYRAWMRARAYPMALDTAVRYLAARPRTEREVEKRLAQAGYDEASTEQVIARLRREGYLNDAQFADLWVEARGQRALGARRIGDELRRKGVSREQTTVSLAQLDGTEQLRIAAEHAEKLLARTRGKDERDVQRKVLQALIRRGYDFGTAKQALEQAGQEVDEEPIDD